MARYDDTGSYDVDDGGGGGAHAPTPGMRVAGLVGLAGLAFALLLVVLGMVTFAAFAALAALAAALDEHDALTDEPFTAGAIIALVVAGGLAITLATSQRRRLAVTAAAVLAVLAYMGASSLTSPTLFATAALSLVVCVGAALALFGCSAHRALARGTLRAVRTSSFWAGCAVAGGALLPLLVLPMTLTATITALGTGVMIVSTAELPKPAGPTATSVAVLRWFADVASTPSNDADILREKWALPADGGAEATTNSAVAACMEALATPRVTKGVRALPLQDVIGKLEERGLSRDDAHDIVTLAMLDVCTSTTAPPASQPDMLRALLSIEANVRARALFRVPPHADDDADPLRCGGGLATPDELARVMASARASLSERDNRVLTLYSDDKSLTEIAWHLKVSKSQARREFHAALDRLCGIMAARGCPMRCGAGVAPKPAPR